jgi:hypothetical protein
MPAALYFSFVGHHHGFRMSLPPMRFPIPRHLHHSRGGAAAAYAVVHSLAQRGGIEIRLGVFLSLLIASWLLLPVSGVSSEHITKSSKARVTANFVLTS